MRQSFIATAIVACVAFPGAVLGQSDWVYISGEGQQYSYSMNSDGAVLKSLYPVARFQGTGAMTEVITGIETLYLGRNCEAYAKVQGKGTWSWANGGFVVEFDGHRIGFPRQEIDANNNLSCGM